MRHIIKLLTLFFLLKCVVCNLKAIVPPDINPENLWLEWTAKVDTPQIVSAVIYANKDELFRIRVMPKRSKIVVSANNGGRKIIVLKELIKLKREFTIKCFFEEEKLVVRMNDINEDKLSLRYPEVNGKKRSQYVVGMDRARAYSKKNYTKNINFFTYEIKGIGVLKDAKCGTIISDSMRVPQVCHLQDPAEQRIVGGTSAMPATLPWQVSIRSKPDFAGLRDYPHKCGGTLLHRCWVLTAGHCVPTLTRTALSRLVVRVGDYYNQDSVGVPPEAKVEQSEDLPIRKVFRHSGYGEDPVLKNDIALIKLGKCATIGTFVRPICLPAKNVEFSPGSQCVISGWGAANETEEIDEYPRCLQRAYVTLWQNSRCKRAYEDFRAGESICAKGANTDSCQGDSGGPLVCYDIKPKLWGVTSWGIGCGRRDNPGVYTSISNYLTWIYEQVGKEVSS